jgi:hypothetical protein
MAIGAEELFYEMTVRCLLYAGSEGVPTWETRWPGEQLVIKKPKQFKALFATAAPLSEDIGEAMARWASGSPRVDVATLVVSYAATDRDGMKALDTDTRRAWRSGTAEDRTQLKAAIEAAKTRLGMLDTKTEQEVRTDEAV